VRELPTTVLLNRKGVVVAVDVYGEDIERRLHGLLSEDAPEPAAAAATKHEAAALDHTAPQADRPASHAPPAEGAAASPPAASPPVAAPDTLSPDRPVARQRGDDDAAPPNGSRSGHPATDCEPPADSSAQAATAGTPSLGAQVAAEEGAAEQRTADQPAAEQPDSSNAAGQPAAPPAEEGSAHAPANPYLAPRRYTVEELAAYLEKALAKPRRVQERPGFLEAVVDAADRILASDAPEDLKLAALLAKFRGLHGMADAGNAQAGRDLEALVDAHADDSRPAVAAEVRLHQLARRAARADDMSPAELAALLEDLKSYFEETVLDHRHLTLASAAVHAANLLPDMIAVSRWYRELGALFAASEDRELAAYGKKLRRTRVVRGLVGQPLELEGTAVDGRPFSWKAYRGKVVLVAFWATWCGPCRDELPFVKQNYERWHQHGFEVVGISLDEDKEALLAFLKAEGIEWVNLFGEGDGAGRKHPMAVKYKVQAIPYTLLVDREGRVLAEGVRGPDLEVMLERLLGGQAQP
jgi:thiol-disulfide isomerase/thioredoxin